MHVYILPPSFLATHTHTPVFYGRFDDRNGVILQVVVDPHIPDAEVLVGRLMHRLLEVGVKPQHLQRYQLCIYIMFFFVRFNTTCGLARILYVIIIAPQES